MLYLFAGALCLLALFGWAPLAGWVRGFKTTRSGVREEIMPPIPPEPEVYFYQYELGVLGGDEVFVQAGSVSLEDNRGSLRDLLSRPITHFHARSFSDQELAIPTFTKVLSEMSLCTACEEGPYKVICVLVWWDRPLPTDTSVLEVMPRLVLSPSNVSLVFPANGGITHEQMVLMFPNLMAV